MKTPFFYGWTIAVAAGFGIACSIAVFLPAVTGLLVGPFAQEFGWSPPAVFASFLYGTVTTVLVSPFIGVLVDRFGARRIIVTSLVLEGLIVWSHKYLDGSLAGFYLRAVAFNVFCLGGTQIAFAGVVSKWFTRRRGLALGIALAGTGVGGAIWSLTANALFASVGWRNAFEYFGLFFICVAAPFFAFILRNTPAEMNLLPDGDIGSKAGASMALANQGMTLRQAAGTVQFWMLLAVSLAAGFGVYGIMINVVPIMKKAGDPNHIAALVQASLWGMIVIGRLLTGFLLDRIFAPRLAIIFLLFPIAGAAMFATGVTGPAAFAAAMLVGLGVGAEVDALAYMVSRYFGLANFSRIYACNFAFFSLGVGLGPAQVARLAQQHGDYSFALWAVVVVLGAAVVLLAFFRPFPRTDSNDEERRPANDTLSSPLANPKTAA